MELLSQPHEQSLEQTPVGKKGRDSLSPVVPVGKTVRQLGTGVTDAVCRGRDECLEQEA